MKLNVLEAFDFFTGVPDSQLKALCNYLVSTYGISKHHVIAANEGNAVGLAAGYHLATHKSPNCYTNSLCDAILKWKEERQIKQRKDDAEFKERLVKEASK